MIYINQEKIELQKKNYYKEKKEKSNNFKKIMTNSKGFINGTNYDLIYI